MDVDASHITIFTNSHFGRTSLEPQKLLENAAQIHPKGPGVRPEVSFTSKTVATATCAAGLC